MELKLWIPNFLRIDSKFKIVWSGGILPPGTLLYPYQTPILQTIQLKGFEEIPINLQEVCYKNNPYSMQKKAVPKKVLSNLSIADTKYSGNLYLADSSYKHRKIYFINRPK